MFDLFTQPPLDVSLHTENGSKQVIGYASVDIQDFLDSGHRPNDAWHDLRYRGVYSGSIHLILTFIDERPASAYMRKRRLLFGLSKIPLKWEVPERLDEALQFLPLDAIYEAANKALSKQENPLENSRPGWELHDQVIKSLIKWFKESFFTWVNNPVCTVCSSPTVSEGDSQPDPKETMGSPSRVEIYRCSNHSCNHIERFLRYQDPFYLLQTRRGRVGEWTNCCGMLCRALGALVRFVWCPEDHVWLEVFSKAQSRWIHVDPCDESWDNPLLYTKGNLQFRAF